MKVSMNGWLCSHRFTTADWTVHFMCALTLNLVGWWSSWRKSNFQLTHSLCPQLKAKLQMCSLILLSLLFSSCHFDRYWSYSGLQKQLKHPCFCCHRTNYQRSKERTSDKKKCSLGFKRVKVKYSLIFSPIINTPHSLMQNTSGCKCRSAESAQCIHLQSK